MLIALFKNSKNGFNSCINRWLCAAHGFYVTRIDKVGGGLNWHNRTNSREAHTPTDSAAELQNVHVVVEEFHCILLYHLVLHFFLLEEGFEKEKKKILIIL